MKLVKVVFDLFFSLNFTIPNHRAHLTPTGTMKGTEEESGKGTMKSCGERSGEETMKGTGKETG